MPCFHQHFLALDQRVRIILIRLLKVHLKLTLSNRLNNSVDILQIIITTTTKRSSAVGVNELCESLLFNILHCSRLVICNSMNPTDAPLPPFHRGCIHFVNIMCVLFNLLCTEPCNILKRANSIFSIKKSCFKQWNIQTPLLQHLFNLLLLII